MKQLTHPTFEIEKELWNLGFSHVIGIDEVGRGAFAGPIVASAVIFDPKTKFSQLFLDKVNDSKLLKHREREKLEKEIKFLTNKWSIGEIDVAFINKHGIGKANIAAFRKVVKNLQKFLIHNSSFFILIDGFHGKYLPGGMKKQKAIVKGDQKTITIAAASILAKVHRDKIMRAYARKFGQYGFGVNKGYGTKLHQKALFDHGLTPIHRTSFGLSKFLNAS